MRTSQTIHGDSYEVLKTLPENSVDSIVTDPPYGLSFMGKVWDYEVPSVELWKEAIRVLKPGGHLLSFAGSRTYHRMAVNIEDAGFEIRDMIAWVYGSGFPKSHNISKAINKIDGVSFDEKPASGVGFMNESDDGYNTTKNQLIQSGESSERAKKYEGWGTALKPALEPITVARKPLSEKTVAQNVLKWGTGGINIDGCRVRTEEKLGRIATAQKEKTSYSMHDKTQEFNNSDLKGGRFPANLIHDGSDEVVGLFPDSKSTTGKRGGQGFHNAFGRPDRDRKDGDVLSGHNDSGSAARFFYCSKASKKDRNEGLEGFEEVELNNSKNKGNLMGSDWIVDPRHKDGGYKSAVRKPTANNHPTVKPTALMQYLVRLVTPVGGTVLDPFMGSGSTGIGAKLEGFGFIGIELDESYVAIAKARISAREPDLVLFNRLNK